ncbi:MAG: thymidylate synthase [Candidatus Woesearchaeota archaeon]
MRTDFIEARDISDAWFQCIERLVQVGRKFKIDSGSYAGQYRIEFDYVTAHIKYPGTRPLSPDIPPGLGIPAPCNDEYIENDYLPYLMTAETKQPDEDYTYGERLVDPKVKIDGLEKRLNADQIEEVIRKYKEEGHRTNQCVMEIGMPSDIKLKDPPCLRLIDTRIQDDKLHFFVYFRSWDLWGGFPVNLGGIQLLKEYMAEEIGVEDGEIIASSKGLHIYDHGWDLAKIRVGKK